MSERPLRIAVVGLGDIAVSAHLPAIEARSDVSLAAVADLEPERLAAWAPRDVPTATDPLEIFGDPGIDAVVIATPPSATPDLTRAALTAGKYVLAEKPIALTADEAERLRIVPGALERLQIGLTYRHHPAVERLRELIAEGELGAPLLIQATISDERADPEGDPRGYAKRLRSLERTAPIISDGVHAFDRLNFILDATPVEVTGWSVRTDPAFARPNVNGGALTYADGTIARVEVVWMTPVLPPSQFVVTGPAGCAVLDPPTFELTVELADGRRESHPPPGDKTSVCFARQLDRFVAHWRAGTRPVPGFAEAIASLEVAERVASAAGIAVPA